MKKRRTRPGFEKVEYKPTNVKELLTEMKDISTLMIDLAYAALIFDSSEIAGEVVELESRMDHLLYQTRMTALVASRTIEDAESLTGILQVASAAEDISNAAGDIATISGLDIEARPFIPFVLRNDDEPIRAVTIMTDSSMVGRSIGDLDIEDETRVKLLALRRRKRWVYDPPEQLVLKAGDLLIVRGVPEGYQHLKEFTDGKRAWPHHGPSPGGVRR